MERCWFLSFFFLVFSPTLVPSFVIAPTNHAIFTTSSSAMSSSPSSSSSSTGESVFELTIDMPPSNSDRRVNMKIESVLSVPTELVVVRYQIPFGLNVEPMKNLAVVTSAGPGGERPGDILRYCSAWQLGLPEGDGIQTTVASFAGGLSWQCTIFNVIRAKAWEQVVEALTSNTPERTDEVVLIFERPLDDAVTPPELQ